MGLKMFVQLVVIAILLGGLYFMGGDDDET